tara:strand:+ start:214 stop:480 length:267 start_codon:yes stop_codon:yes gene_type:complete
MAIEKTLTLKTVSVNPKVDASAASTTNAGNTTIYVQTEVKLDDDSDSTLPVYHVIDKTISRYVSDGGSATDVSAEDALVQSIAGAIWS